MPSETRRIGLPPARASLPSSFRTVGKEPMSNNQLALNFFSLLFIYKTEQKESNGFSAGLTRNPASFYYLLVYGGHWRPCFLVFNLDGCRVIETGDCFIFESPFRGKCMCLWGRFACEKCPFSFFLSYFSTKSPQPKMALGMTYRSLPGRHLVSRQMSPMGKKRNWRLAGQYTRLLALFSPPSWRQCVL